MTTIYDDIQALRERFKREFGLTVAIDINVFPQQNRALPSYPARQVVDLACRGGIPAYPEEWTGNEGGRWFKLNDWRNGVEIVLYR